MEETTPPPVATDEPTPSPVATEATPSPVATEEPTPSPVTTEKPVSQSNFFSPRVCSNGLHTAEERLTPRSGDLLLVTI